MCKLIRRLICLVILFVAGFFVIAILRGGEPIRWFGMKSEETGKVLKKKSEELAEEADMIKKRTEAVKKGAEVAKEKSEKLMEKVKK
jgi:nitrogen regulatory protein PII-like uncharacterized protein